MPPLTDSEILKKVKQYLEEEIENGNDHEIYFEAYSYLLFKITRWERDNG
mgnify:CR=1 FL=1